MPAVLDCDSFDVMYMTPDRFIQMKEFPQLADAIEFIHTEVERGSSDFDLTGWHHEEGIDLNHLII
jgi:hypothetical protein